MANLKTKLIRGCLKRAIRDADVGNTRDHGYGGARGGMPTFKVHFMQGYPVLYVMRQRATVGMKMQTGMGMQRTHLLARKLGGAQHIKTRRDGSGLSTAIDIMAFCIFM